MEDNDYGMRPPTPKAWTIIKTVVKSLFIALIIFIYGFFALRLCTSNPKTDILITKTTHDAYIADKDNFVMYTQNPQIFIDEHDSKQQTGYNLAIFNIVYIPQAKQLQVTVRYNKSVFGMLEEKYGSNINTDEPFVYSLLFEDGTRIASYTYKAVKTNRYHFRYLVFDNVELEQYEEVLYTPENSAVTDEQGRILAHETDEDGNAVIYETLENGMSKVYINDYVYLDAYYIDDVDFGETPAASLLLFDRGLGLDKISPSKYNAEKIDTDLLPSPYFINNTATDTDNSNVSDTETGDDDDDDEDDDDDDDDTSKPTEPEEDASESTDVSEADTTEISQSRNR